MPRVFYIDAVYAIGGKGARQSRSAVRRERHALVRKDCFYDVLLLSVREYRAARLCILGAHAWLRSVDFILRAACLCGIFLCRAAVYDKEEGLARLSRAGKRNLYAGL